MNNTIAMMLKNSRISANMTQQQVADVLKVKKNTISNYENAVSSPSMDDLAILCDLYGIDMGAMLNAAYGPTGGRDVQLSYTASEISIIDAYRQASDDDRAVVDAALRKYINSNRLTLVAAQGGGVTTAPSASASAATAEHTEAPEDGGL